MKKLLLFCLFLTGFNAFAQTSFPSFLVGKWQVLGVQRFERWDKLNDQALKGFAYDIVDGKMMVYEYLDIARKNNQVVYNATIPSQNEGKPIDFKMTKSDSVFSFDNPSHNFPQKIVYKKISDW